MPRIRTVRLYRADGTTETAQLPWRARIYARILTVMFRRPWRTRRGMLIAVEGDVLTFREPVPERETAA